MAEGHRLVLIDTVDELPGLLPLHAWTALMSSEVIVVGRADHPFAEHLANAELRVEVIDDDGGAAPLTRVDLLGGLAPGEKQRAERVAARALEVGELVYLYGPGDSEVFTRSMGMKAAQDGLEVEVVYFGAAPKGTALLELVAVQQRLRAPDGCPWDAEQDHASLARYAVEETYELLEAIEAGEPDAIREELGDVLLQVVFHAQVAEDDHEGFDIDDVARGIAAKLVRRHPHVFDPELDRDPSGIATPRDLDSGSVVARWDELKAAEKPERTGVFDGVVTAQPSVPYAEALQRLAAKQGFEWRSDADAADRVRSELDEVLGATTDEERVAEIGDLLLSVVGLARRLRIDPELALRGAAARFRRRFLTMLQLADGPPEALDRDAWSGLWERAKETERVVD